MLVSQHFKLLVFTVNFNDLALALKAAEPWQPVSLCELACFAKKQHVNLGSALCSQAAWVSDAV